VALNELRGEHNETPTPTIERVARPGLRTLAVVRVVEIKQMPPHTTCRTATGGRLSMQSTRRRAADHGPFAPAPASIACEGCEFYGHAFNRGDGTFTCRTVASVWQGPAPGPHAA